MITLEFSVFPDPLSPNKGEKQYIQSTIQGQLEDTTNEDTVKRKRTNLHTMDNLKVPSIQNNLQKRDNPLYKEQKAESIPENV